MRSWTEWRRILADEPLPAVLVDLDAVDRNLRILLRHLAPGRTLRLASKSVRVPAVCHHLLDADPRVRGLMTFAAGETRLLADQGFGDLLCAYPVGRAADAAVFAELAAREQGRSVAMVDARDQVTLLSRAAVEVGATIPVCLDIDVSLRVAGQHLGVRRSPLRGPEAAVALARHVRAAPGVDVVAVMAYEAQVAGLPDRVPGNPLLAPVHRWIKRRSRPLAARRRRAVVDALTAAGFSIGLVNGGGTGSIASTSSDGSCTEVTAGSGFYCPTLFDGYDGLPLEPACFFALPVVRRSDAGFVTCAGGGWIASGPPDRSRAPRVHLPAGLRPLGTEGFGEVQTPLAAGPGAPALALGDPVLCRHAKAGEVMERVNEALLVRGGAIVERAPTLRGLGGAFL